MKAFIAVLLALSIFQGGEVGSVAFSYQFFEFLHELLVAVCCLRYIVEFMRRFDWRVCNIKRPGIAAIVNSVKRRSPNKNVKDCTLISITAFLALKYER